MSQKPSASRVVRGPDDPLRTKPVPLTDQQAHRLQELWVRNESALQAMAVYFSVDGNAEEMLCDLGLILARGQFAKLAEDCTDLDFQRLAFGCLRYTYKSHLLRMGRQPRRFKKWLRMANPPLLSESFPEDIAERNEAVSVALSSVEELAPRERDAIVSFYLRGESQTDICRRWGVRRGAHRTVQRGLRKLRENLPESIDPGGMTRDEATARMGELRRKGASWNQIAKRFGFTGRSGPIAVKSRLKLVGRTKATAKARAQAGRDSHE